MDGLFTLKSARRILPEVRLLLEEAMRAHAELNGIRESVRAFSAKADLLGGVALDGAAAIGWHQGLRDASARLRDSIERLQQMGVQVKDLEMGLADFPTVYRGREVLLCWKMGEPDIAWWHGADEGFGGRKPVDADFELNHGRGQDTET